MMPRKYPVPKQCEYCDIMFVCSTWRQVNKRRFCDNCLPRFRKAQSLEWWRTRERNKATCAVCKFEFNCEPKRVTRATVLTCSLACCKRARQNQLIRRKTVKRTRSLYRYGPGWDRTRIAIRKRDKYTCQDCGVTEALLGKRLDVHHIIRFLDFTSALEANKENNLIALCHRCHKRADTKLYYERKARQCTT